MRASHEVGARVESPQNTSRFGGRRIFKEIRECRTLKFEELLRPIDYFAQGQTRSERETTCER